MPSGPQEFRKICLSNLTKPVSSEQMFIFYIDLFICDVTDVMLILVFVLLYPVFIPDFSCFVITVDLSL